MSFDLEAPLPRELFLLDPGIAFLNHGSFGATPRPVLERQQAWQRVMERQPVEFLARRAGRLLQEARAALAAHVGAAPANLVYVGNATTALNVVAHSLRLEPGDEVVATDHEYGAMDRMWRSVCDRQGAVYRPVPIPLPVTTPEALVDRLWAGVTPRTRVLFFSHLTSPTALILPARELCRRARAAGVLSVVDGAHAPGQVPLAVEDLGADFYAANAHKWLCGPKGSAFLYARPAVQALVEPLIVSWGAAGSMPAGSSFLDELQWTGTRDLSAFLSVPDAIRFCAANDWERVQAYAHALAGHARTLLGEVTGRPPICPDSADWYAQMVAVSLPPCDGRRLQARLYDRHGVEVPVIERPDGPLLRVSIQGYNTPGDVERLVKALRSELAA